MNDLMMRNTQPIDGGSSSRLPYENLVGSSSCIQAMGQTEYSHSARIDATAVTATAINARTNPRAFVVGQWLHTPKFGTFDHSHRWRFAT